MFDVRLSSLNLALCIFGLFSSLNAISIPAFWGHLGLLSFFNRAKKIKGVSDDMSDVSEEGRRAGLGGDEE